MFDNRLLEEQIPSPTRRTVQAVKTKPMAMFGFWGLLLLTLVILVSALFTGDEFELYNSSVLLRPPSWMENGTIEHFLGTDDLGRDLAYRVLLGTRFTFGGAVLAVLVALIPGVLIGLFAGMKRGLESSILHHLLDTLLAIPTLLFAVILVATMGTGFFNTLIAITLALMPQFAQVAFNATRKECEKEYVIASSLDGSTPFRILRWAILPNIMDTLVVQTTKALSAAVMDISIIGFLGLGAQAPQAEWGAMVAESGDLIFIAPWVAIVPGSAIFFTVFCINFFGEGVREALEEENR